MHKCSLLGSSSKASDGWIEWTFVSEGTRGTVGDSGEYIIVRLVCENLLVVSNIALKNQPQYHIFDEYLKKIQPGCVHAAGASLGVSSSASFYHLMLDSICYCGSSSLSP